MSIIARRVVVLLSLLPQDENASRARQGLSGEPTNTPALCRQDYPVPGGRGPPSSLRTTGGLTSRGGCTAATVPVSRAVPFHNRALRMRCCPQPHFDDQVPAMTEPAFAG